MKYVEPLSWASLWLMGSTTSYQYGDFDDLDLNLVVNLDAFLLAHPVYSLMPWEDIRRELHLFCRTNVDGKEFRDGKKMQLFVRKESEVVSFLALSRQMAQGIYNVHEENWLVHPLKIDISFDPMKAFQEWAGLAENMLQKIEDLIAEYHKDNSFENLEALMQVYSEIRLKRHDSFQGGGGQFGQGNFIWQYVGIWTYA